MTDNSVVESDVIIVGTGFAGLGLGTQLRRHGFTNFIMLERASGIGGTWRENTYPGAACDIQSHLYSYSFRPNPDWSRMYAGQPEILDYLEATAQDEGLYDHIRFNAEVTDARWNEDEAKWRITAGGTEYSTRVLVTASGHLSDPKVPDIEGIDKFGGHIFHSARWNHDVDLTGLKVGVLGTGASAIQIVPAIAGDVGHLSVFQRSAPYVIPRMDRAYSDIERALFRKVPSVAKELRDDLFWGNESRFPQRRLVPDFIDQIENTARVHREAQVTDPELLQKVTPDYQIGCKRILISNDYYPALAQPNVELETASIASITDTGAVLADGREVPLDVLILSTGFEASDLPISYRIFGDGGQSLAEHWSTGGQAFACTTVAGFPNLFVMLGPNTGLGAGSIIYMVETQVQYILEAVEFIQQHDVVELAVPTETEEKYVQTVADRSQGTVWLSGGCKSWYVDRNNRLTTLWPDFMTEFRRENGSFDASAYLVRTSTDDRSTEPKAVASAGAAQ